MQSIPINQFQAIRRGSQRFQVLTDIAAIPRIAYDPAQDLDLYEYFLSDDQGEPKPSQYG